VWDDGPSSFSPRKAATRFVAPTISPSILMNWEEVADVVVAEVAAECCEANSLLSIVMLGGPDAFY